MTRFWTKTTLTLMALSLIACGTKATGSGGTTGADGAASDAAGSADAATGGDTKSSSDVASDTSTDATSADAGKDATSDAGPTCTQPELGVCEGTTVKWCEDGKDQTLDCKEAYKDVGAATCAKLSDEWGHDCVIATGEACSYEENDEFDWAFCAGKDAGCIIGKDDAKCATGVATCKESDIDACVGDLLVFDCAAGQPLAVDCKVLGGACGKGAKDAACTKLPEGAPCDGELLLCGDGLVCDGATKDEDGTCKKKT